MFELDLKINKQSVEIQHKFDNFTSKIDNINSIPILEVIE